MQIPYVILCEYPCFVELFPKQKGAVTEKKGVETLIMGSF